MKNNPFLEEEEYFRYFEEIYSDQSFSENYPLISRRMKSICETIKVKINAKRQYNFFRLHAEIMGLDAQLQILLLLVDVIQDDVNTSEEMVLKCSQEDYLIFMREFCGSDVEQFANHSLFFSVI